MTSPSRSVALLVAGCMLAGCEVAETPVSGLTLEFLGTVGSQGEADESPPQLQLPVYLREDGTGAVWTLDTSRKSVVRLSAEGVLLDSVGRPGRGPGELSVPVALDIAPDGRIWIADPGNGKILAFRDGVVSNEFLVGHQPLGVVARDGEVWVAGDLVESVLVRYDEQGNRLGTAGVPEARDARRFRFNQGVMARGSGPCSVVWAYTFHSIVECFGPAGESVWRTVAPGDIRPSRDADPDAMSSGDRFAYVDVTVDDGLVYALFVGGPPGKNGLRTRTMQVFDVRDGIFRGTLELPEPAKFITRRGSVLAALDYAPEPLIRLYRVGGLP